MKMGDKKENSEKSKKPETLSITNDREIAADFAMKAYREFDQMIKSIVLFGSAARKTTTSRSDIDIIIIIDDVAIRWDTELIAWYREELGKIISRNPYIKPLHINTVKLSTWWRDVMRADPVVMNILRYGEALIDFGGFYNPLKILLKEGQIRTTPESIYTLLERAPNHLINSRRALLSAVEGLYWTMVDSAHAALIAAGASIASPEEIPEVLNSTFVKTGKLNKKYVQYYDEIYKVSKEITHGSLMKIKGAQLDEWFDWANDFLVTMAELARDIVRKNSTLSDRK